jgi:hypothetical protein
MPCSVRAEFTFVLFMVIFTALRIVPGMKLEVNKCMLKFYLWSTPGKIPKKTCLYRMCEINLFSRNSVVFFYLLNVFLLSCVSNTYAINPYSTEKRHFLETMGPMKRQAGGEPG